MTYRLARATAFKVWNEEALRRYGPGVSGQSPGLPLAYPGARSRVTRTR
jgi:hypothetical protein